MSTLCRPMMTIVKETPEPKGIHDTHNRMCNRFLFESHGGESQDGCHEIISKAVEPYGILPEDIPDTLDVFMNYQHNCETHRWRSSARCPSRATTSSSGPRWTASSGSPTAPRTSSRSATTATALR